MIVTLNPVFKELQVSLSRVGLGAFGRSRLHYPLLDDPSENIWIRRYPLQVESL
jgi:hypothetical protein